LNAAAVTVALSAAVAFGWSTALMHHSASRAPLNARGMIALFRHLLVQPRWLIGMFASLAGLGLHAWALKLGSLAVVQPLVVTGLVFAFIFRAALDRQWPSHQLMGWVLLTACGITIFLFGAHSTSSAAEPSGRATAVFLAVGVVVAAAAWLFAGRVKPNHAGLLLGLSGGVVFGLIAGVLKTVTGSSGLVSMVTSWPVYVLLALGATGFVINQRAYSSAPLSSSLPVLNVVNPVIAVIFGVLVFDERPSRELHQLVLEVSGLVLVLAGVSFLARIEDQVLGDAPSDDQGLNGQGLNGQGPNGQGPNGQGPNGQSPNDDPDLGPFPFPRPEPRPAPSRTP
jgi:drug/metabolite transporter (DMT)-like permease